MHVHLYERAWMWAAGVLIAALLGAIALAALGHGAHPPSHVETIDPKQVFADPRFAQPGVVQETDGSITVTAVAMMFAFRPNEIRVPAGRPVTFLLASPDVVHGFQIVGTNGNAMVVPGYVTRFTATFAPGEYLVVCNEYCGLGHHAMSAKLVVEEVP